MGFAQGQVALSLLGLLPYLVYLEILIVDVRHVKLKEHEQDHALSDCEDRPPSDLVVEYVPACTENKDFLDKEGCVERPREQVVGLVGRTRTL